MRADRFRIWPRGAQTGHNAYARHGYREVELVRWVWL